MDEKIICYSGFMSQEEFSSSHDSAMKITQGAWKDFPAMYQSPIDAVRQTLSIFRGNPRVFLMDLPQVPIPDKYQNGDPLPLELELAFLLKGGCVGDRPTSIVTFGELLECAQEVWGLDDSDFEQFKATKLLEAQEWYKQFLGKLHQDMVKQMENRNLYFLSTWNAARFDALIALYEKMREPKIDNLPSMVQRYQNIHRKAILELQEQFQQAQKLESADERRQRIQSLYTSITEIICRITFLTPTELENITSTEQQKGYLYLDTLADILPELFETASFAKNYYSKLTHAGFAAAVGEDAVTLGRREQALDKLVYGANDNKSVRGIIDTITKKPIGRRRVTKGVR